ncbi:hypothetical protein BDB01DRAFT_801154 [Pilobolus umbonatus]|nr:hypothetical protein BDB01DRAFT_801154 [Pilobolus umbonatus]
MITARIRPTTYKYTTSDISCRRFHIDNNTWNDSDNDQYESSHYDTPQYEQSLSQHDKDRFIELAQAALEEAKMEEEQKGLLHELIETLIAHTGAPMVADVILEQFRSQDVIEQLAEDHFNEQKRRNSRTMEEETLYSSNTLTEPINLEEDIVSTTTFHQNTVVDSPDMILLISEYSWRFFRLLILASLVGLIYHFMCVHPNQSLLSL